MGTIITETEALNGCMTLYVKKECKMFPIQPVMIVLQGLNSQHYNPASPALLR